MGIVIICNDLNTFTCIYVYIRLYVYIQRYTDIQIYIYIYKDRTHDQYGDYEIEY